jgi:uncharacterized protein
MVTLLVGVVIVIGLTGTLLPVLPGLGLIWLAIFAYGLIGGFGPLGWTAMAVITALLIAGTIAAVRVPQRAAAAGGIGWRGQLAALVLAVIGFFVIPVVGAPIGFVAGVYLAARRLDRVTAWETTKSTLRALVLAAGVQFIAGLGMALTWGVWVIAA